MCTHTLIRGVPMLLVLSNYPVQCAYPTSYTNGTSHPVIHIRIHSHITLFNLSNYDLYRETSDNFDSSRINSNCIRFIKLPCTYLRTYYIQAAPCHKLVRRLYIAIYRTCLDSVSVVHTAMSSHRRSNRRSIPLRHRRK